MCLLGIAFQVLPEYPVFLFANREENRHRQTAGPTLVDTASDLRPWVGGMDLQAGGTWLGINQCRLIVAVTNRQKRDLPQSPRSRGLLCRDLLGMPDVALAAAHAQQELQTGHYAGCNFLLASANSAVVIEAGDDLRMTPLRPGFHLLSNGDLNDQLDPRICRVRRLLGEISSDKVQDWITAAETICGLPATAKEPAICRTEGDWGTVSSSVIVLGETGCQSTYRHAAGPPSGSPYEDFGNLIQQLRPHDGCD